jgi:hypothetical protein
MMQPDLFSGFDGSGRLIEDGRAVEECQGWIYFGASGDKLKIGYSVDPPSRIKHLDTGAPDGIELIGVIPAPRGRRDEAALHERFAQYHHRNEWFLATRELGTAIAELIDSARPSSALTVHTVTLTKGGDHHCISYDCEACHKFCLVAFRCEIPPSSPEGTVLGSVTGRCTFCRRRERFGLVTP